MHPVLHGLCILSLAYLLATVSYFIITRFMGAPLNDSLSDEQREIKKQSVKTRSTVFFVSLGVFLLVLMVLKPLESTKRE